MSQTPLPPGLMLVHGNRQEDLRDLIALWMRRYPLAPLEAETVLVHSNGIAQWLRLALAEEESGCGIAAALDLCLPARFLWRAYRCVLGPEAAPERSPFDRSLLVWRLMRLLPQLLERPDYAPLRRFLANDAGLRKRFQLAERLAELFDQYQVYRADWLAAWAENRDILIRARGEREPLPEEQRWQARLWRALLDDTAATEGDGALAAQGRAAVHEAFLRALERWPEDRRPAGLPRRAIVFGVSALPRQSLEALAALSRWCQILMCVHNPCEHYWADIVADRDLLRAEQSRQKRRHGAPTAIPEEQLHLHAHPLLAAWGKQGRDFIGLLDEHDSEDARADYLRHFAEIRQRIDVFESHGESCLLNQLQEDIRLLRPLAETRKTWPAVRPDDASIRFHSAHSPQREIEALHDWLLAAFDADPGLRPRDTIVMVPDIDAYAPHIRAVFGLHDSGDPRYIPFCIADQGRRKRDPLVHALGKLLELPTSRIGVGDALDWLEVPALRSRFGIAEDDLPLLRRWIRGAQVRWGFHAEHRARFGLPDAGENNTWRFGLRRMLLGYAVGAGAAWREIEPFDEIGGLDAALLGPLAQFLERLEQAWRALAVEATPDEWTLRLRALVADFFAPEESADAYTLQRLDEILEEWREACEQARFDEPLPLATVAEHWLDRLEEGGLSARFFAGAVTFATLMPMRAIPFRQVCLLGLNDGAFPRQRTPLEFDLMGRDYRPGDRSRREDDRYLFLEALLSARERLLISWVGHSVNDNAVRPPSVLVGQLRDHLAAGWRLAGRADDKDALLQALTVEHRLQPFNPDYFPSEPGDARLFTYAREWRIADDRPADDRRPLPDLPHEEPLRLSELAGFLRAPAKAFFQRRLRVNFDLDDPAAEDHEPFALDGLQKWTLWDELIARQATAMRAGQPRGEALAEGLRRIRRRGELAAGAFAEAMADELAAPMDDLFGRYAAALARWPIAAERDLELRCRSAATGLEIEDWLRDLRLDDAGGRGRIALDSGDLVKDRKYRHHALIRHWLPHLAAQLDGCATTSLIVGKVGSVEFAPLTPEQARAHIEDLLAAWREGMRRPLPLAAKTAFAWLETRTKGGDAARLAYEGSYNVPGEAQTDPYLARAWPDFERLTAGGEFETLAERLLAPLYRAVFAGGNGGASVESGSGASI